MAAAQPVQFWFQVISMKPREDFAQRFEDGEWRPPRPQSSNVLVEDGSEQVWYKYSDGETAEDQEPDAALATHFKTFSLYVDGFRFWIYPCNAILYQVGDGRIHPPPSSDDSVTDSTRESSPEENNGEDDNSLEDWKPLTFIWGFIGANTTTSCATVRASHEVLQVQRDDQTWIPEVLPDRYHAPPEPNTSTARPGGLVGKLPILIALIAFSVASDSVSWAMTRCLRHNYNTHGRVRGDGWTPRRGVVVRVFRQRENEQQGQPPENNPAFQRMRSFEYGHLRHGNFFP